MKTAFVFSYALFFNTCVSIAQYSTVTDVEGNTYNTIRIGDQLWMAENLNVTKYRNGDEIGTTSPDTLNIVEITNPKYQWAYEGNESYAYTYGRLYTWFAITDDRGVCPSNWHIPTDDEWTGMEIYLQNNGYTCSGFIDTDNNRSTGSSIAKSLSALTEWTFTEAGWAVGNTDLPTYRNKSGFTALPGAYRNYGGGFGGLHNNGFWWSSSEKSNTDAWSRSINFETQGVYRNYYLKSYGFSVRCIKD